MPRVVAIADLHGNLPGDLPEGDVLVIAGDVCPIEDHSVEFQDRWLKETFAAWLDSLPHAEVIWIAGNHDFVCIDYELRSYVL
jgi:3',5'-cyclic AMP phosphodiesterase CpdA